MTTRPRQGGVQEDLRDHTKRIRALEAIPAAEDDLLAVRFNTYPQPGDYLYVSTSESSPHSPLPAGIHLHATDSDAGRGILLESEANAIRITSYGTNPGIEIWGDDGAQISIQTDGKINLLAQHTSIGGGDVAMSINATGGNMLIQAADKLHMQGLDQVILKCSALPTSGGGGLMDISSDGYIRFSVHDDAPNAFTDFAVYDGQNPGNPVFVIDVSTSPPTYHIATGAAWVADL